MNIQTLIANAVNQFTASLTSKLKPNESAAIQQIVTGTLALLEAEAVNRGVPALLSELTAKYPALAAVIAQIPELKSLFPAV